MKYNRVIHLDVGKLPKMFKDKNVAVGLPRGKINNTIANAQASLVEIAVWNEFGTRDGRIPARPFLFYTLHTRQDRYIGALADGVRRVIHGKTTVGNVLDRLGIVTSGDVKLRIRELRDPPNAESTIVRKGSSNPLIDTGNLRQSITYEVRHGHTV